MAANCTTPDQKTPTLARSPKTDWIAATILAILTVGCFVFKALQSATPLTTLEVTLFDILQFLLTVGFTWFSSRALSRTEFEESLKRFAISAYRRVADVDRMVGRLRKEVREMILRGQAHDPATLRIVEAIVMDTEQVVR